MKRKEGKNEESATSCSSLSPIQKYWLWRNSNDLSKLFTKDKTLEGTEEMSRSRGELKIEDILRNNDMSFETEYIFPELVSSSGRPLRFDFAVFDDDGNVDFLIEYQGEQHYASVAHFGGKKHLFQQKYNDNQKRIFCAKKGIPLLAVPYWEFNKLTYDYIINAVYGE